MKDIGVHSGGSQKSNHWLQIPLSVHVHTGPQGIDSGMGVESWEKCFGPQVMLLKNVSKQLGYDVFKKAGITINEGERCNEN
jgi:hypothetical protein